MYGPGLLLAGRFSEQTTGKIGRTLRKVHTIEQIEDFAAKLKRGSLLANEPGDVNGLDATEIHVRADGSERRPAEVSSLPIDEIVRTELRVIVDQIHGPNQSMAELEKTIGEAGSKLEGHMGLTSIKGTTKQWSVHRLARNGEEADGGEAACD